MEPYFTTWGDLDLEKIERGLTRHNDVNGVILAIAKVVAELQSSQYNIISDIDSLMRSQYD